MSPRRLNLPRSLLSPLRIPATNLAEFAAMNDRVRENSRKAFERLKPLLRESQRFQQQFAAKILPFRESFLRAASQGFPKFSKPLRILAENGWFISWFSTPVAWIYPLSRLFEVGHNERANRRLRNHFKEQASAIEARIVKRFPRRAAIVRKAFRAHRQRDYELSIPIFLIQADGIAKDIIGSDVYSRRTSNVERLQEFVGRITFDNFQREIIELILLPIPLNASTGDPRLIKGSLSRHHILHGIETQYGTATNSYRAISWLQYVASFEEQKDIAKRHRNRKQ